MEERRGLQPIRIEMISLDVTEDPKRWKAAYKRCLNTWHKLTCMLHVGSNTYLSQVLYSACEWVGTLVDHMGTHKFANFEDQSLRQHIILKML